jgi:hypothetical protein
VRETSRIIKPIDKLLQPFSTPGRGTDRKSSPFAADSPASPDLRNQVAAAMFVTRPRQVAPDGRESPVERGIRQRFDDAIGRHQFRPRRPAGQSSCSSTAGCSWPSQPTTTIDQQMSARLPRMQPGTPGNGRKLDPPSTALSSSRCSISPLRSKKSTVRRLAAEMFGTRPAPVISSPRRESRPGRTDRRKHTPHSNRRKLSC